MALALRRITSTGRFVPEIDGLRFMAIFSVVVYHFHGFVPMDGLEPGVHDWIRAAAAHGYRGVNLFYVISGFILGLPFAAHHLKGQPAVSLRSYFLRRLTRLEPPYILNLLICFALLVLLSGVNPRAALPHLAASMAYLHNLWFGEQSSINPVAWTLEVEVQFYCLAPLLAGIYRIRSRTARRALLAGAILLAGIVQMMFWSAGGRIKLTILYAAQFFLAGLLLADLYLVDWNEHPATHWAWDLGSLACWPLIFAPPDLSVWLGLPFLMIAAFAGAFHGIAFRRLFRAPAITTIGGMCYTIYLFHYQLIPPVVRLAKSVGAGRSFDARFLSLFLIYAPVLLGVSLSYYVLIERPCMAKDWPRRLGRRITRSFSAVP
jgi:peptidoglycan/LPS O-acetylase OafA/YrhL